MKINVGHWLNDTDRRNRGIVRETCPIANVFTKDLTWTDLASNQRLCGERPATLKTRITLNCIKIQSVPRSKHSPSRLYKPVS
jgi:hypothetical protein